MSWTNTGGGDHEGQNWVIDSDITLDGVHYNIATFTVESGVTITQDGLTEGESADPFTVQANRIVMNGTINGNGQGHWGGQHPSHLNGYGPGGSPGSFSNEWGTGGGGHGGAGGYGADSTPPSGAGGSANGSATDITCNYGSGSGVADEHDGAAGGGAVVFIAETIIITGTITVNGSNGGGTSNDGAGGGSGGGVVIIGNSVDITNSTLSANGGTGYNSSDHDGGGGGGGRIKIFGNTVTTTGSTVTVNGGVGGGYGQDGFVGTYNTYGLGVIDSVHSLGQTFTSGDVYKSSLSSVVIYVNTVSTSGVVTCSLYDDDAKTTLLASKADTISATGEHEFTLATPYTLDPSTTYFLEITSDGTADILAGIFTPSDNLGGSMYVGADEVDGYDIYVKLSGFGHLKDMDIYNTSDETRVLEPVNNMLVGAIHTINADGTGTVQYTDNFSTEKYVVDQITTTNVTYDSINDRIDITVDGFAEYLVDTKYPITGIPKLTALMDFIYGTPQIQVSLDGTTWVDIDDSILLDGVETEFELRSNGSVDFKGETRVRFRISSCGLRNIVFDANIITVDSVTPTIDVGDNTFRVTQPADSNPIADVTMSYRAKRWM